MRIGTASDDSGGAAAAPFAAVAALCSSCRLRFAAISSCITSAKVRFPLFFPTTITVDLPVLGGFGDGRARSGAVPSGEARTPELGAPVASRICEATGAMYKDTYIARGPGAKGEALTVSDGSLDGYHCWQALLYSHGRAQRYAIMRRRCMRVFHSAVTSHAGGSDLDQSSWKSGLMGVSSIVSRRSDFSCRHTYLWNTSQYQKGSVCCVNGDRTSATRSIT